MDYIKIGEFLKVLRKAKGLTQQEVADELYVTQKTISRWERGDGIPDINTIATVAKYYGVTVDELLNGERAVRPQSEYTAKLKQGERLKLIKNKLSSSVNLLGIVAISVGGLFVLLNLILGLCVAKLLGLAMGLIGIIISYAILIVGIRIIKGRKEEFDIELQNNELSKLDLAIKRKSILYYDLLLIEALLSAILITIYLITGTYPSYTAENIAFVLFVLFIPALYIYIRKNIIIKDNVGYKDFKKGASAPLTYASVFMILAGTAIHLTYVSGTGDFTITEDIGILSMQSLLYMLKGQKLYQAIGFSVGLIGIILAIVFFMLEKPYLIAITGLITSAIVPVGIMDYYSIKDIKDFNLVPTLVGALALITLLVALIYLIIIDTSKRKKIRAAIEEN